MITAALATAMFVKLRTLPKAYLIFLVILGVSLVVTLAGSLLEFPLNGRSETVQLYRAGGGQLGHSSGTTRYLTSATMLAVSALYGSIALLFIHRRLSLVRIGVLSLSGAICLLSFSRNQIVGLVGVILFVAVAEIRSGHTARFFAKGFSLTVAILITGGAILAIGPSLPGGSWLSGQLRAYQTRVVEGLTGSVLSVDSSTQDRVLENRYMFAAIDASPLLGQGFGYAYKPAMGHSQDFSATGGRYYGHNLYLWLWMKGGLLTLVGFLWVSVKGLRNCIRARESGPEPVVLGAALSGLLLISILAPVPTGFPGGVLFGGILGAALSQSQGSGVFLDCRI
jgi:O-antigen ligase